MRVSELITKLSKLRNIHGDLEVLISDGYDYRYYQGKYEVNIYVDCDGNENIDIGIGGCKDERTN